MSEAKREPINGLPAGGRQARRDVTRRLGFAETADETANCRATRRKTGKSPSGSVCTQVDCAEEETSDRRGICSIWKSRGASSALLI